MDHRFFGHIDGQDVDDTPYARVLVLDAADPVPPATPAGVVIVRRPA